VLALMRLSASRLISGVSWTFSWIFRSTPLLVQLLLWYNLGYLYERVRGDPLHRDRPDRHPHQRSDDPDAGRDPGAGPAPGGLRRRADPRRHPLGRPGPARGGRGAGHPRPGPLPADRPAAGDAGD